jgi:uncharacterized membrane protein
MSVVHSSMQDRIMDHGTRDPVKIERAMSCTKDAMKTTIEILSFSFALSTKALSSHSTIEDIRTVGSI